MNTPELREVLKESLKQNEEYICDLTIQIKEKRIILNYIIDELIKLREQKKEENIINYLEDEFERLRKERCVLEERLFRVKESMRCFRQILYCKILQYNINFLRKSVFCFYSKLLHDEELLIHDSLVTLHTEYWEDSKEV